jgi:hypothetical protein
LVFGVLAVGAAAGAGAPKKRVAGRAERVSSVCGGGAAITDEQIARLPPPVALGGMEFIVVAGNQITAARPVARFVTRPDGTFTTHLPPGTWCFLDAGRKPPNSGAALQAPLRPSIDAGCLESAKRRCDLVLPVKSDVRDARITFMNQCPEPWNQPCYRGPMPP